MRMPLRFAALLACLLPSLCLAADYVWREGEAAVETNFPRRSWYSASTFEATRHEILSGGDWLSNSGNREGPEAFATYRIEVPATGTYHFWARKFWKHGPFRWRFDDGPWRICSRNVALADSVPIREHLSVNWVYLGEVELEQGRRTFELRLLAGPGEALTAAFDCFLLTPHMFLPRGKLKPGERSGKADAGWWAFEPDADAFDGALLDLRALNEPEAGRSGHVRRDGSRFALGDGTPVRFWAVNVGGDIVRLEPALQRYLARRLAKVGVNMVRIHAPVRDGHAADLAATDADFISSLHRLVAELKREGIYTSLSFYFPLWVRVRPEHGLAGYDTTENKHPFGLLFFDPAFQAAYRGWAKALLTTLNPHTGLTLAADPAVAIVEIVNEDSLFFWTFIRRNIPAERLAVIERQFATWLTERYGGLRQAQGAWGGRPHRGDDPQGGRMTIHDIWSLTPDGRRQGQANRLSDQLRFMAETQRGFYAETASHFRETLGVKAMIVCGNWKTADPGVLDAVRHLTYTEGDVIDTHGYFSPRHEGRRSRFAVDAGDRYENRSGLKEPEALPLAVVQVEGYPQIISEIGWPNPNRFKGEFPALATAAASIQGVDGIFFFAVNGTGWSASTPKFPVSVPSIMGQFPAAALMYRRGDLPQAEAAVVEAIDTENMMRFTEPAAIGPQAFDALRLGDLPPGGVIRGQAVGGIDPMAFFAGPVRRAFGAPAEANRLRDLSPLIDRQQRTFRTACGGLRWNYGTGVLTIDTPRTQGAVGFLGRAGDVRLGDIALTCRTEFAAILVTSLDDLPLAQSRRVLVQTMTEERPYGWRERDGVIESLGGYPLNVRQLDAELTLPNRLFNRMTPLDVNGLPGEPQDIEAHDARPIRLPSNALYTIVTRE